MRIRMQGFTLIEIMVVVVILGILGALIVPNVIGRPDEARAAAARLGVQEIGKALEFYRLDNGFYPSSDQGIEALVDEPAQVELAAEAEGEAAAEALVAEAGGHFLRGAATFRAAKGAPPKTPRIGEASLSLYIYN